MLHTWVERRKVEGMKYKRKEMGEEKQKGGGKRQEKGELGGGGAVREHKPNLLLVEAFHTSFLI
jgi:hypothetical protein